MSIRLPIRRFMPLAVLVLAACTQPEPVQQQQLAEQGRDYVQRLQDQRAALNDPLTLSDALARAVTHNLEFRVRALKTAIASGNRNLANMEMLPQLSAKAGYTQLSRPQASVSQSLATGRTSLRASTAQDEISNTASLELNWNLLDFTLGWFRAREKGHETLIAREERRRVIQQKAKELVHAWDRVRAFEKLEPRMNKLQDEVRKALRQSEQVMEQRLRKPEKILEYRKSLLLTLKRLQGLFRDMEKARGRLARLVNLPAGQPLELADGPGSDTRLPLLDAPLESMQLAALLGRPEVRKRFYRERMAESSGFRKVARILFPAPVVGTSKRYDSNSFLVNNHWTENSASLSWQLAKLASLPLQRRQNLLEEELATTKTQLKMTAVLSQVAVADRALYAARESHCISQRLNKVDARRLETFEARTSTDSLDQLTLVKARVDHLLLRAESALDRARRRRAILMLYGSLGVGAIPEKDFGDPDKPFPERVAAWLDHGMEDKARSLIKDSRRQFQDLDIERINRPEPASCL